MPVLLANLLQAGLGLISNAVLAKGKEAIEEKLGVKLEETLQTPEGILKLQQLQHDHEEELLSNAIENRKLDLAEYQEEVKDRSNARDMQGAALKQDDVFSKRFVYIFAILWSVFAMLYMAGITFGNIPKESIRFADTITGFLLGTVVATLLAFFYGSTMRNHVKDDSIKALSEGIAK